MSALATEVTRSAHPAQSPLNTLAAVAAPRTVLHAPGDGIGEEISHSVVRVLEAAGAPLSIMPVQLGQSAMAQGAVSGVPALVWRALRKHGALLKGPLMTPQGGGFKSVNVTLRKRLGLFANVRPVTCLPQWSPRGNGFDVVIIRENEEDTYAGIEHQQTADVTQCLKLITRAGCERIVRYAFEYARSRGRKRVTCMTKDNIMKRTDGLFHEVFEQVSAEYPELDSEHLIIDIGMARLATVPERFDVVVMPNLYGDIASDVLAEVSGSVGLAASANLGASVGMFEAVHGSAPDIAGRGIANPGGLLSASCMMLEHLGHTDVASNIRGALLTTLEDGIHTADLFRQGLSSQRATTEIFTEAVIERLGSEPKGLTLPKPASYAIDLREIVDRSMVQPSPRKTLVGVDLFVEFDEAERNAEVLAAKLQALSPPGNPLGLQVISNRGVRVWPGDAPLTLRTDHWRCRFQPAEHGPGRGIELTDVLNLQQSLAAGGVQLIKSENLYLFDDAAGFSAIHGA